MHIVREDTMNFIGSLFEALVVSNYFKDPSHQMCQIFKIDWFFRVISHMESILIKETEHLPLTI